MRRLGLTKTAAQWKVVQLWPQIVGEAIAKIAQPRKVIQGTLYVGTSSSSWANELDFRKCEILSLIKKHLGETGICDIRFQSTSWRTIEEGSTVRKTPELDPSEKKKIEAMSEKIENLTVRQAFEKLLVQATLRARKP